MPTDVTAHPIALDALPGPRGWPLLGNYPQIDFRRFHTQLEEMAERYGEFYRITLGPSQFMVTGDLEVAQRLLKERPERFGRRVALSEVFAELGFNGLFSAEDDDWRRQRKVVITALNSAHLHSFFPALRETTGRLEARWQRAAAEGRAVDLPRDLMRYTVDVTTQLAFGIDFNTLETDGHVIQDDLDHVFPMLNQRLAAPVPYWRWFRLPRDRALDRAVGSVRARIGEVIAQCRARLAADPARRAAPANFLEAMIVAQESEQLPFSDEDIVANVFTLLLAGEDTTANTLAWAMKLFIDHPAAFAAVQAEVDAALGAETLAPNHTCLDDLPQLEAFANETMRLRPVAPLIIFEAREDTVLGGVELPKGASVILLTRRLATRPEHFGDPAQFNPARWLPGARQDTCPHNPRAFVPFGGGPRFCPGRNLALLEIRMVLAMVCRNFDLTLANPERPVREDFSFTTGPADLEVHFTRRNSLS